MTCKWGIFWADLNPVIGSEQKGRRPVLVVSDEEFNRVMSVVTVLPLTSLKEGRKIYPNEALVRKGQHGMPVDSLIMAHQVRTISKERLRELIGTISEPETRNSVNYALRVHLNL